MTRVAPLLVLGFVCGFLFAAQVPSAERVPHGQSRPPGPPLSPAEAIEKMTVPDGFTVELVAGEPDIVNPVAMTIDARGRFWVTESLEYPRRSPGKGRDRVKVLEDTDGDGRADKFTIFADGLNIPSGIAVGYGGVWVANAPDILFMQDTDGDGRADRSEVVVTGFGREDTHELPNSLTWGPDGWLYGLNGVFNHSHVEQNGKQFKFTCALFRIHPRTREFQLFAEGTSNPWGVAFDPEGSAFVSACVIDHLWHLAESGYYHRQGGPYPPFTWKIGSIVDHKHQQAAYCGIHYFDSDAYPPKYRDRLYMGNIHGGCINVDRLRRDGSTYRGSGEPDFLSANDAWFMPVVQKTGPDGSLYILDWYDRYHCYQDANRDPQGIDRLKGRLYRVRYRETPRAPPFDMTKESNDRLIERLASPNVYFRAIAQRLLCERNDSQTRARLESLVLDDPQPRKARMHALWSLVGTGRLSAEFHQQLFDHDDSAYRAWAVRAAGDFGEVNAEIRNRVIALAADPSPDVRLQVAIAARKIGGIEPIPLLVDVLAQSGDDTLVPHIVWQNLHPLLERHHGRFLAEVRKDNLSRNPSVNAIMPRATERLLAVADAEPAAELFEWLIAADAASAADCLSVLSVKLRSGELDPQRLEGLTHRLAKLLGPIVKDQADHPLHFDAALVATHWKDPAASGIVKKIAGDSAAPARQRLRAIESLVVLKDADVLRIVSEILDSPQSHPKSFRAATLAALGPSDHPSVGKAVLERYEQLEDDLKPKAVQLLTQRASWSKMLLHAIGRQQIPRESLSVNRVRQLLAGGDDELRKLVLETWGSVRTERNPQREEIVAEMRRLISQTAGDAGRGQAVFMKVCGQCHKIYGEGQDVGPDVTSNGRSSFAQLLSNVFDPSLVIGASYQARTLITRDGRVLTGLPAEDSELRVVLTMEGGKQEVIPREEIEALRVSPLSMMPEGVEKQLKPQEIADLFEFLTLDRPPGDPRSKYIPGTPRARR